MSSPSLIPVSSSFDSDSDEELTADSSLVRPAIPLPPDWIFSSPDELSSIRSTVHHSTVTRLSSFYSQFSSSSLPEFPPPASVASVISYYHFVLFARISSSPSIPATVLFAAITFYRRFYLLNSPFDYLPVDLLPVCLSIACKAEEAQRALKLIPELFKGNKSTHEKQEEIARLEVPLLEGIRFQLFLVHPLRSFQYWMKIMKNSENREMIEKSSEIESNAFNLLLASLHTDVSLLAPPSLIALAAVRLASERAGIIHKMDEIIKSQLTNESSSPDHYKLIIARCSSISDYLLLGESAPSQVPEANFCREVEKKIKKCRNRLLDPNTVEYEQMKKKIAEEKMKREEIKMKKVREEQQRKMDELLMGGGGNYGGNGEFVIAKRRRSEQQKNDQEEKPMVESQGSQDEEGFVIHRMKE
jgi:cyclin ccl1